MSGCRGHFSNFQHRAGSWWSELSSAAIASSSDANPTLMMPADRQDACGTAFVAASETPDAPTRLPIARPVRHMLAHPMDGTARAPAPSDGGIQVRKCAGERGMHGLKLDLAIARLQVHHRPARP